MKSIIYPFLIFSLIVLACKKTSVPHAASSGGGGSNYTYHNNPGNSSGDFLRSTIYKSLNIEIQYMPGLEPDEGTVETFVNFLEKRLNKPGGVFIQKRQINPTLKTIFSVSDISDIENRNRRVFTFGDQLGAYILIIDGSYDVGNTLSLAYGNTSICVFGEPLKYLRKETREGAATKIMAMLFEHEFGHLMGLVNMGTYMIVDHMDNENSNHCQNSSCLMHHSSESIPQSFADIPSLDANCLADLQANGGK